DCRRPKLAIEALETAVQCVFAPVATERVAVSVDLDLSMRDAVGVTAHETAVMRPVMDVVDERVVAEQDALGAPGGPERFDGGAEVQHLGAHTARIAQGEFLDGAPVAQCSEMRPFDRHALFLPRRIRRCTAPLSSSAGVLTHPLPRAMVRRFALLEAP